MGTDLVSACIFCAGLLLGMDLTPRNGPVRSDGLLLRDDGPPLRRDAGASRLLGRDAEVRARRPGQCAGPPRTDSARERRPPSGGPAIAFATSHDEQERKALAELDLDRILTTGTGRYENFALLGRVEGGRARLGGGRRSTAARESATDLINIGGENSDVLRARSLSAAASGLARSAGDTAGRDSRPPSAFTATQARRATTRPPAPSRTPRARSAAARREARWKRGGWTCAAAWREDVAATSTCTARACRTSPTATRRSRPRSRPSASGGGYSWPRIGSLRSRRPTSARSCPSSRSPCSATETVAFDSGLRPGLDQRGALLDLAFRYAFTPGDSRAAWASRLAWGTETVTLTDSAGRPPPIVLDVLRRGSLRRRPLRRRSGSRSWPSSSARTSRSARPSAEPAG